MDRGAAALRSSAILTRRYRDKSFACAIDKSMNAITGHATHAAVLPSSAIGVWLHLDFGRHFNESPDCFGTRWQVGLAATPVVYGPQKLLRYPHLKWAILGASRWAATRAMAAYNFFYFQSINQSIRII